MSFVYSFCSSEWIISGIIILIHWWLITKFRNLPMLHSSWLAVFWHSIFSYYPACFWNRNLWGMKSWMQGLGSKAKHKVRVCDSEIGWGQWKSTQSNRQSLEVGVLSETDETVGDGLCPWVTLIFRFPSSHSHWKVRIMLVPLFKSFSYFPMVGKHLLMDCTSL